MFFLFFCLFGCFIARFLHQFSYFAVGLCVCLSVSVFLLDFSFGFYTSSPIFGFLGVVDLSVFFLFVCLFACFFVRFLHQFAYFGVFGCARFVCLFVCLFLFLHMHEIF